VKMGRTVVFVLLLCFFCCTAISESTEGKRLIQFSDTKKEWLEQSEVDQLVFQPSTHNFIDVTEFDLLYSSLKKKEVDPTPIPTKPIHQEYVKSLLPLASISRLNYLLTDLSNYYTRYYTSATGVQAAKFVQSVFEAEAIGRSEISVKNFTYSAFPQTSVIATIPGTGPNKASVVVIGGHLDSVGSSATGRSPGADDDGSGTVSVLEIFRILVESDYKPDYTLQFMAYAAEEVGLRGSQGIATEYAADEVDVYAVLQLDMTGYKRTSIGIIQDNTSPELNAFLRTLVETYTTLTWQNSNCGYGCSDHASWNKTGVRASFPFETPFGSHNPNIHSANDVISNLSLDQMLQFVFLGVGFAVELAGIAPL